MKRARTLVHGLWVLGMAPSSEPKEAPGRREGQVQGFLLPLLTNPEPLALHCAHCPLLPAPAPTLNMHTPPGWPHLGKEEVSVDVDGGEHQAHEQHDHAHRQVAHAAHRAPLLVAVVGGPLLLWTAVQGQRGGGPEPWNSPTPFPK